MAVVFLGRPAFGHAFATAFAIDRHDLALINGGELLWMLPLQPAALPQH